MDRVSGHISLCAPDRPASPPEPTGGIEFDVYDEDQFKHVLPSRIAPSVQSLCEAYVNDKLPVAVTERDKAERYDRLLPMLKDLYADMKLHWEEEL
jgi:hypothetical protein